MQLPFMEISSLENHHFKQTYPSPPKEFGIYIENAIFKEHDEEVF
jgi:hypothetical protein